MPVTLHRLAGLMVHPLAGRAVGAVPVAVPMALAGVAWMNAGARWELLVIFAAVSAPALAAAFMVHELGHLVMFRCLGLNGRLTFRPPIDLRAVPHAPTPADSTGTRLVVRAMGGWLANMAAAAVLAAAAVGATRPKWDCL